MEKSVVYALDFGMYDEFLRIIKVGKSNDLDRRNGEHTKGGNKFIKGKTPTVLLSVPVSKYNAERYEDKNRDIWDSLEGFTRAFHCKDTFLVDTRIVQEVSLTIKKTYTAVIPV